LNLNLNLNFIYLFIYLFSFSNRLGISFPTCVSVNNIICHFSPLPSDDDGLESLKNGDLVKIQLGAQVDGFAAIVATTIVVGASKENPVKGPLADLLTAAYLSSEAALRLIKPGLVNMKVTETIQKIAKAFDMNSVEGLNINFFFFIFKRKKFIIKHEIFYYRNVIISTRKKQY